MTEHRVHDRPVGELISDAIDRALSDVDEVALDAHLGSCRDCRVLRDRLWFAARELRSGTFTGAELASARKLSLQRVRASARSGQRSLGRDVLVIAGAVAAVIIALVLPRAPAAGPSIPERETVAERSTDLDVGLVTVSIEQGRTAARRGENIGVLARADIRFARTPTSGVVELRVRQPDEAYGMLSANNAIAGATRVRLEGAFPPNDSLAPITYEVWVHIETSEGAWETPTILVDILPGPGGPRARVRPADGQGP